jgi:hypothetical protein
MTPGDRTHTPRTSTRMRVERVESGSVMVRLRVDNNDERRAVREAVKSFSGLSPLLFSVPTSVEDDEREGTLVLSYPRTSEGAQPFLDALSVLRRRLPESTPQFMRLSLSLWDAMGELADIPLGARWLGPRDLLHVPEMPGAPWRVRVVPALSETFGERLMAGAGAWGWMNAEGLGRGGDPQPTRIVGAALYHAFVGEFHGATLATGVVLQRVLRGRLPRLARLEDAIEESLPYSFDAETRELAALVGDLLDNDAETSSDALHERVQAISRLLTPLRLAVRFEHEQHPEIALRLVEDHARSMPPEEVAWDTVTRMRWWARDGVGALEAALHGAQFGQQDGVRSLIRILRDAAAVGAPEVTSVLAASVEQVHPRLLEMDVVRLAVADFELRVLRREERLDALLDRSATTPWYELVRRLMQAQRSARQGEYAKVARIAEQALAFASANGIDKNVGGAYAAGHLAYLNGIAHYGAVATYNDSSYLGDAIRCFMEAIEVVGPYLDPADPLLLGSVHWLEWIVVFARQLRAPNVELVRVGVEAYLAANRSAQTARGIPATATSGSPSLIWYRIERLLPI